MAGLRVGAAEPVTGRENVTVWPLSAAVALVPPVTVAMMILLCPALTVVGLADSVARATTVPDVVPLTGSLFIPPLPQPARTARIAARKSDAEDVENFRLEEF